MNLIIRKAVVEDADLLAKTRTNFLEETTSMMAEFDKDIIYHNNKTYFEKALANNTFTAFLAYDGELLVGTSGICFYNVPPNYKNPKGLVAFIQNMYTLPGYRKQGIATKLFFMTLEEARNRGYKKLTLNATSMGRPLYEKFGFKDTVNDMVHFVED